SARAPAAGQSIDVVNSPAAGSGDRSAGARHLCCFELDTMSTSNPEFAEARLTPMEIGLAVIVLFGFLAAQLVVMHGRALFNQTPWLDEVHTLIVVNEPDPAAF